MRLYSWLSVRRGLIAWLECTTHLPFAFSLIKTSGLIHCSTLVSKYSPGLCCSVLMCATASIIFASDCLKICRNLLQSFCAILLRWFWAKFNASCNLSECSASNCICRCICRHRHSASECAPMPAGSNFCNSVSAVLSCVRAVALEIFSSEWISVARSSKGSGK